MSAVAAVSFKFFDAITLPFQGDYMSIFVRLLFTSLLLLHSVFAISKEFIDANPALILATYGKPDQTISSEYDKPRPMFITRTYEYKKENVRIVLLVNEPHGSKPPFKKWKLLGYQDIKTNAVISLMEAERRLISRKKK